MKDVYASFADRYDLAYESLEQYDPQMGESIRRLFVENRVPCVLDCVAEPGGIF